MWLREMTRYIKDILIGLGFIIVIGIFIATMVLVIIGPLLLVENFNSSDYCFLYVPHIVAISLLLGNYIRGLACD